MKKIIIAFLNLILILLLTTPVLAANNVNSDYQLSDSVNEFKTVRSIFDAEYYISLYPDLLSIVSHEQNSLSEEDKEILYNHYISFGINEGRICSKIFNLSLFIKEHPELYAVFFDDYDKYVEYYFYNIYQGMRNQIVTRDIDKTLYFIDSISDGYVNFETGSFVIDYSAIENGTITLSELERLCGENLLLYKTPDGKILFIGGNCARGNVANEADAIKVIDDLKDVINFPSDLVSLKLDTTVVSTTGDIYYRFYALSKENGYAVYDSRYVIVGTSSNGEVICVSTESGTVWNDVPSIDMALILGPPESVVNYTQADGYEYLGWNPSVKYKKFLGESVIVYYYKNDTKFPGKIIEFVVKLSDGKLLRADAYSPEQYNEEHERNEILDIPNYEMYSDAMSNATSSIHYEEFTDGFGNVHKIQVLTKVVDGITKYCFIDPERNMIATDSSGNLYYRDNYNDYKHYVSSWFTIAKCYDFYKELGFFDMLGKDIPIMMAFCDEKEENNASCSYKWGGLNINIYNNIGNTSFDGVAHEFGHGIQDLIQGSFIYQGITGAIAESYADILGNLMEMIVFNEGKYSLKFENGKPVDIDNWSICETTTPIRNMRDPNEYSQPGYVGDKFYLINNPRYLNVDNGGVHTNSGILSRIAYEIYIKIKQAEELNGQSTFTYSDYLKIWYDTLMMMNNSVDYGSFESLIIHSLRRHDYGQYESIVHDIFNEANCDKSLISRWSDLNISNDNNRFVGINAGKTDKKESFIALLEDDNTTYFYKDIDGIWGSILDKDTKVEKVFYSYGDYSDIRDTGWGCGLAPISSDNNSDFTILVDRRELDSLIHTVEANGLKSQQYETDKMLAELSDSDFAVVHFVIENNGDFDKIHVLFIPYGRESEELEPNQQKPNFQYSLHAYADREFKFVAEKNTKYIVMVNQSKEGTTEAEWNMQDRKVVSVGDADEYDGTFSINEAVPGTMTVSDITERVDSMIDAQSDGLEQAESPDPSLESSEEEAARLRSSEAGDEMEIGQVEETPQEEAPQAEAPQAEASEESMEIAEDLGFAEVYDAA